MKRHENVNTILSEDSLNKILANVNEYETAVITHRTIDTKIACNHNTAVQYSPNGNEDRNNELKAYLLSNNYELIVLDGITIDVFATNSEMDLEAITYLVINRKSDNNFRLKIAKLGEYYCHDSILIIPKGGKDAYLLGTNNACLPGLGQQYKVGEFNPKTEGTFVSKKNTTTITFENWDHNNVMGKWAISSTAKVVNEFVNEHLLPKQER